MPFQVEHQVDLPTDTLLKATLKELDTRTVPYVDKKTGEQKEFTKLNWLFEITQSGDFFGKTVRAESSAFLSDSPYNQFKNWAEALLQRELTTGQVLSESDLIGLPALISIKYETDRKDSSKKWPRVDEVISVGDTFDEAPF